MTSTRLVISVIAQDRPGIVSELAEVVAQHGGNWLDSSLATLGNHFAGIVQIAIADDKREALTERCREMSRSGIHLELSIDSDPPVASESVHGDKLITIDVEANDREGIVEEITRTLATLGANVIRFTTQCESAAMAGYDLFHATLEIALPESLPQSELEKALESLSDDLMLSTS